MPADMREVITELKGSTLQKTLESEKGEDHDEYFENKNHLYVEGNPMHHE